MNMENVKVLPKGQITIPVSIRRKLNIKRGDIISLEDTDGGIVIKKGKTLFEVAGSIKLKKDISNKELIRTARENMVSKNA